MRGATRRGPAGAALALATAAILSMLAGAPGAALAQAKTSAHPRASEQASDHLDDALARFRALAESPTARSRPELWDQAASRFEAILRADPTGPRADEAAYLVGEVYHERYHTFHTRAALDRAIAAYRHVLARYPHGSYADDALYQLGEINYYQLGDSWNAYVDYRRIVREYPSSDMAPRARMRIAALDQARRAPSVPLPSPGAVVDKPPSGGKPLSSPGAAVGELPKGRKTVVLGSTPAQIPKAPPSPAPFSSAPADGYTRPLNPLLEEGPIPLRKPSDHLPHLPPSGQL